VLLLPDIGSGFQQPQAIDTSTPLNATSAVVPPFSADEMFLPSEDNTTLPEVALLPPRKDSPIARLTCLPRACSSHKHFLSSASSKLLLDPNMFTVLSSFPGSGNTLVRSVIEEGTRVFSGSMYHDTDLLREYGFQGEMRSPWPGKHSPMSVIKSHYPLYIFKKIPLKVDGAVHILRAPFDALLSEFNRQHSNSHVGLASVDALRHQLTPWAMKLHMVWKSTADLWAGPRFWEKAGNLSSSPDPSSPPVVTSFTFNRSLHAVNDKKIPVLVMFYEDFVRDFEASITVLFTFLKQRLGEAMPSVTDAVACAMAGRDREAALHRSSEKKGHLAPHNPYHDPKGSVGQGIIDQWCRTFDDYWYEAKWGRCQDAKLQVERHLSVRSSNTVPAEGCA
jgi:hypothetical protein